MKNGNLLLLALVSTVFFGGCSVLRPREDPTRFYVLRIPAVTRAPDATSTNTRQWRMGIKSVEIPNFLNVATMAVRSGPNEVAYAEFSRWAEPLGQGIPRLLKEGLGSSPKIGSVELNSHGGNALDCEVTLQIVECEGVHQTGGGAAARFKAAWEIRTTKTTTLLKRGIFAPPSLPWNGTDFDQLAAGLSEAVYQFSQAIAAALPAEPPETP